MHECTTFFRFSRDYKQAEPNGTRMWSDWTVTDTDDNSVRTSHTAQDVRQNHRTLAHSAFSIARSCVWHRHVVNEFCRSSSHLYVWANWGADREEESPKILTKCCKFLLVISLDITSPGLLRSACPDCAVLVLGASSF